MTDTKSISTLFENFTRSFGALIQQILLNHLNYIGIIPFYLGLKQSPKRFWIWLGSILFILILKSDHFVNHAYYLMFTSLISTILMADGFKTLSPSTQKYFSIAFILMGLLATQHHWRALPDPRAESLPKLMKENHVSFGDRIAVYDSFNPQILYLAKKTGWYLNRNDWIDSSHCPHGAKWALLFDSENKPTLIACQN